MAQITLNSSGVASNGTLALQSNGTTTAVTIDASQNVGIGIASPVSQLHLSSASDSGMTIYKTGVGAGNVRVVTQGGGSALAFGSDQSTGTTERMRIDSGGNVGIGTSSPSYPLQVRRAGGAGSLGISVDSVGSIQRVAQYFAVGDSTSTTTGHALYTRNGTATDNLAVLVDSSGNLLVGTTTTYATNSRVSIAVANGTSHGMTFRPDIAGSYRAVNFNNSTGGANVGYIDCTASATTYSTSSDYRLKENIAPMTGALAKVAQLNPVTYNWKVDGSDGQGFIAHELQAVVPDCVVGQKDAVETYTDEDGNEQTRPVYQGIDTSFLVATLTAAIQEQQAIITSLTDRITALEAK